MEAFWFSWQVNFYSNAPTSPIWVVVDKPVLALQLVDRFVWGFASLFIADDVGASDTTSSITSDSELVTEQVTYKEGEYCIFTICTITWILSNGIGKKSIKTKCMFAIFFDYACCMKFHDDQQVGGPWRIEFCFCCFLGLNNSFLPWVH